MFSYCLLFDLWVSASSLESQLQDGRSRGEELFTCDHDPSISQESMKKWATIRAGIVPKIDDGRVRKKAGINRNCMKRLPRVERI
jgi:hypothetical protein